MHFLEIDVSILTLRNPEIRYFINFFSNIDSAVSEHDVTVPAGFPANKFVLHKALRDVVTAFAYNTNIHQAMLHFYDVLATLDAES